VVNKGRIEQVGEPGYVYDNPATPFVYEFLGNVNLFEGRISRGIADVSGRRLAAPDHLEAIDALATAYVRPHDIDVATQSSEHAVEATVDHAVALGSVVRIELSRHDTGDVIEVEIPRDRYEGLKIAHGNVVWLSPRRARFFLKDASNDAKLAS
jgi:sulfate transport system ATP-binding protein